MNVYDFDNTIYRGESVVDFYGFMLRKKPGLLLILPKMIEMLLRYKACRISWEELLETAERYAAKYFPQIDFPKYVNEFWDKNQRKIKKFYIENKKEDDVILSASCGFLIGEMCERLGINTVIASDIDVKTGKIKRLCFREKKAEIFKEHFKDARIDRFYTDSMNDFPMFALSDHIYHVKGNKIEEIKNEI